MTIKKYNCILEMTYKMLNLTFPIISSVTPQYCGPEEKMTDKDQNHRHFD